MGSDPADTARQRAAYAARINRVLDHVDAHLGEPLRLHDLAAVACLSPYHFHRVFAAMTGETLNRLIQRLRVERAAVQLRSIPAKPITAIALDCGFSGSSAFSRSFREAFGVTPGEWRRGRSKMSTPKRNAGAPEGKIGQSPPSSSWHIDAASGHLAWRTRMNEPFATTIEVKDLPDRQVAYLRHTGPYQGKPEVFADLFGRLCTWAGARGLLGRPGTELLAVYHDDPDVTDAAKLRLSACLPVDEHQAVDGEVGKMNLAGGKYAVGRFELGPAEYQAAWTLVYGEWLPASGFVPDDRLCFESYPMDQKAAVEGRHVVLIHVPVRPA